MKAVEAVIELQLGQYVVFYQVSCESGLDGHGLAPRNGPKLSDFQ